MILAVVPLLALICETLALLHYLFLPVPLLLLQAHVVFICLSDLNGANVRTVIRHRRSATCPNALMYSSPLAKYSLHFLGNQSRSVLRHSGTNATFSCDTKVTASVPLQNSSVDVKRVWFKNGHLLPKLNRSAKYRFTKNANNETVFLRLKNLSVSDQGVYKCVAWLFDSANKALSDNITAQFTLTVKEWKSASSTREIAELQPSEFSETRTLHNDQKLVNLRRQSSVEQEDFEESEYNQKENLDKSNESDDDDEEDEEDETKITDVKLPIDCESAN